MNEWLNVDGEGEMEEEKKEGKETLGSMFKSDRDEMNNGMSWGGGLSALC